MGYISPVIGPSISRAGEELSSEPLNKTATHGEEQPCRHLPLPH